MFQKNVTVATTAVYGSQHLFHASNHLSLKNFDPLWHFHFKIIAGVKCGLLDDLLWSV